MTKVYLYRKCSTCRRALEWLARNGIDFELRTIRESPPSVAELREALGHLGGLKKLFNTSGQDYRALGLKERLPTMSEGEALELLSSNGMLVRRPLVLGDGFALAGFREPQWEQAFGLC